MLLIYIVAALNGAALTFAVLWQHGILPALAAAPFGGSAVVMLVALLLYERDPPSCSRTSSAPKRRQALLA